MPGPLLSGLLLGCVLAMLVGPVFFMIINTSIKKGFYPSAMLAVGVFMSDLFFVVLTYYGSALLLILQQNDRVIGITGGLLIIVFGTYTFFKEARVSVEAFELVDDSRTRAIDVMKGFMMNTFNPAALLFWLGVAGTITIKEQFTGYNAALFYGSTLGTLLCADLLKAYVATRLKKLINAQVLIWMNRVCGIAIGSYGIFMIARIFSGSI